MTSNTETLAEKISKLILEHYMTRTPDGEVSVIDAGEAVKALAWNAGFVMASVPAKSFKVVSSQCACHG